MGAFRPQLNNKPIKVIELRRAFGGCTANHPRTFRDVQGRPPRREILENPLRISTRNLVFHVHQCPPPFIGSQPFVGAHLGASYVGETGMPPIAGAIRRTVPERCYSGFSCAPMRRSRNERSSRLRSKQSKGLSARQAIAGEVHDIDGQDLGHTGFDG